MKTWVLLLALLWGCTPLVEVNTIAIKVAEEYCKSNGGILWIKAKVVGKAEKYKVQFRCRNGLQSDFQEMTESGEPDKPLVLQEK